MNEQISKILSSITDSAKNPAHGIIIIIGTPEMIEAVQESGIFPGAQIGYATEKRTETTVPKHVIRQCKAARKEFLNYVKNLDRTILKATYEKFPDGELKTLDSVIMNEMSDIAKLTAFIDIFKEKANEAIMEEVVRLKSQMV